MYWRMRKELRQFVDREFQHPWNEGERYQQICFQAYFWRNSVSENKRECS